MRKVFRSARDLEGYLFRIVDNGGSSHDRYTVVFSDGTYLALSGNPSSPQGFSQSGEGIDPQTLEEWVTNGHAVDLALGDLPEGLVDHIIYRCNEGLEDFLKLVEDCDPKVVAASRDAASVNDGMCDCAGKGIYRTDEGYFIRVDDDDPTADRGPFEDAESVVRASLPDEWAFAGQEYHSSEDVTRMERDEKIAEAVADLEARRDAEFHI